MCRTWCTYILVVRRTRVLYNSIQLYHVCAHAHGVYNIQYVMLGGHSPAPKAPTEVE